MEDKELQELDFTLEDIIREFSDHPAEEPAKEEPAEEAVPEEAAEEPAEEEPTVEETAEEEPVAEAAEEPAVEEPEAEEKAAEEAIAEEPAEESEEASVEDMSIDDVIAAVNAVVGDVEESEETAPAAVTSDTIRLDTAAVTSDTVRLDSAEILRGVARNAQPIEDEEEAVTTDATIRLDAEEVTAAAAEEEKPAFTGQWEPEYEQPMGEYVPPKPIAFPTRAESRDMKRKLVIGPEKKYYELTEKGLGKLQLCMLVSLVVVALSALSTVLYAQGMIPENRLRLMIFGQFLAVLVSGLLGSFQLIQGVADLFKGRFTLNTLLVATFLACCADGVFCLLQVRIPCCAAFSLEVFMSLLSEYHRRHSQLGQMDVLRKAGRLYGVYAKEDAHEGKKVLQRIPGQVEHFMDHYDQPSVPEKRQGVYALIALAFSLVVGVVTGFMQDLYVGIQMTAVSLLAAVPATAFIATSRPFAILQRRLHRLGAVLCGWQGVKQLSGKVIFPLGNEDLFPLGTMRMNGVKFFGSRSTEQILAYATAVIVAEGSSLAPVFRQVLESRNGREYDAQNLRRYENGGIGGAVLDEPVLVGPLSFLKEMGVEVPEGIQVSQAVCVAIDGELCGVFAISYEKTRSATAGLSTLSSYRGLNPAMVGSQFMMSESFIRGKFGIKSKRLLFPGEESRHLLCSVQPDEDAEAALLATVEGLAPMAYCVTGARALRAACNLGVVLHMIGGILGMLVVLALVLLGAMHLLTPANMFLYQLVWMIPGWLVTEWTRSV